MFTLFRTLAVAAIAVTVYAGLSDRCELDASLFEAVHSNVGSSSQPSSNQHPSAPPSQQNQSLDPKIDILTKQANPSPVTMNGEQVVFVLDASGSMRDTVDNPPRFDGMSRWEVAGIAINDWLDRMDDGVQVGLAPVNGSCGVGITHGVPVGMDRDNARKTIANFPFGGGSNINDVLTDLPSLFNPAHPGNKRAVLVTDGQDTCGTKSACEIATDLYVNHGITLDIVSFVIDDPQVIADYQCAAKSTGGRYLAPDNLSELLGFLGYFDPWRYVLFVFGCMAMFSAGTILYRHALHMMGNGLGMSVIIGTAGVASGCVALWLLLFARQDWLGLLFGGLVAVVFLYFATRQNISRTKPPLAMGGM